MHPAPTKNNRSEQARINGAKSRGPKTPQGKERARTAPLVHGLYATVPSLLPTVDQPGYAELRAHYQSVWNPSNQYLADKVDDLVAYRWELHRIREVRRQCFARMYNEIAPTMDEAADGISAVAAVELRAYGDSGPYDKFDLRIRRIQIEISRVERDLIRDIRHFQETEASQKSLKTNEVEPEVTQAEPKPEPDPDAPAPVIQIPPAAFPRPVWNSGPNSRPTTGIGWTG